MQMELAGQSGKRIGLAAAFCDRAAFQGFDPMGILLSTVGYVFLLVGILVGLAIALHLPAMVAAGLPDPSLARELDELFGYSGWPRLLERIGLVAVCTFVLLAAILVIIARRKAGPFHIVRALAATAGLLLALATFSEAMPNHCPQEAITMLNNHQLGPALEKLMQASNGEPAAIAVVVFLASVVLFAWPPRRKQPVLQTIGQEQEIVV